MYFKNHTHYNVKEYKQNFLAIANYTLELFHIQKPVELSVNIVTRNQIHEINKKYRNMDRVTDVISFEFDQGFPEIDGYIMLGDIFICQSKAASQAKMYQHSVHREMCFLFTHGLLHLLKMDHLNPKDEKKMIDMQEKIMNHFKIFR